VTENPAGITRLSLAISLLLGVLGGAGTLVDAKQSAPPTNPPGTTTGGSTGNGTPSSGSSGDIGEQLTAMAAAISDFLYHFGSETPVNTVSQPELEDLILHFLVDLEQILPPPLLDVVLQSLLTFLRLPPR